MRIVQYDFNAPRLYVDADLHTQAQVDLSREQSNYLGNVLRLREGDDVLIFNGRAGEWRARMGGNRKHMHLTALELIRPQTQLAQVHYIFAPLKHARLDYMVQKAVEMGASSLQPVMTRRTQINRLNLERMRANAIEAAEQCGLLSLPDIHDLSRFDQFISAWNDEHILIFCDEDSAVGNSLSALEALQKQRLNQAAALPPLGVFIGPEGGFDAHERKALSARKNCIRLSLGPRILRADTAAVAALALIQACLGDWAVRGPYI